MQGYVWTYIHIHTNLPSVITRDRTRFAELKNVAAWNLLIDKLIVYLDHALILFTWNAVHAIIQRKNK